MMGGLWGGGVDDGRGGWRRWGGGGGVDDGRGVEEVGWMMGGGGGRGMEWVEEKKMGVGLKEGWRWGWGGAVEEGWRWGWGGAVEEKEVGVGWGGGTVWTISG